MIASVLANWAGLIAKLAAVLVLYPFLVGTLGTEQYSVWLLIVSITGNFTLLRLGVPTAMVRYVSASRANDDMARANRVLGTALGLFLSTGFVVILAGLALTGLLDSAFNVPAARLPQARIAFSITVAAIALSFPLEVLEGALHAFERFVPLNVITTSLTLLRVGMVLLFIEYERGLEVLALITGGELLLQGLVSYCYLKKTIPKLCFSLRLFDKAVLKEILSYSIFVLILHAAVRVSFNSDPMVIGAMIGPSAIVFFSVANQIITQLLNVAVGVQGVIVPRASVLFSAQKHAELRDLYLKSTRLSILLYVPFTVAFFTMGDDFIALWVGEEFREASGHVLAILAGSYFVFLAQQTTGQAILMATSNVRVPTLAMAVAALFNLSLSIFLAPEYGIAGVAWGTALPNYVYACGMMLYTLKLMQVSYADFFVRALLLPATASIFFLTPVIGLEYLFGIDSLVSFVLIGSGASLLYATACYQLFLQADERLWLRGKLLRQRSA